MTGIEEDQRRRPSEIRSAALTYNRECGRGEVTDIPSALYDGGLATEPRSFPYDPSAR